MKMKISKISRAWLLKSLQFFFLISFIIGLFFLTWNRFFISLGCFLFLQLFVVNIGWHRYFAHQSFKTYRWVEIIFIFFGSLVGQGSLLVWVAGHLSHHRHSDTIRDIHSPHFKSLFYLLFSAWDFKMSQKKDIQHLLKDKVILFFHKYYFLIHIFYSVFLLTLNPILFIYAYTVPSFLCLLSVFSLVTINHWHGYRTYKLTDYSTNSWISNIITLGEGWHNNHHYSPNRYYQGERWWELDPPAFFIRLFLKKRSS